jgi:hypothetical protein
MRGAAEEELMTRAQHVCSNKGCRGYALGGDDEQEGAQRHRRRGDDALVLLQSCFARKIALVVTKAERASSPLLENPSGEL